MNMLKLFSNQQTNKQTNQQTGQKQYVPQYRLGAIKSRLLSFIMAIHVGFLNILSRILILEYQITTRVLVRFPSTRVLVDIPTLYPYKLLRINLFHIEKVRISP